MNRITQLFQDKTRGVLSIYMTAGYPELGDTVDILKSLQDSGVDMVEIGMPFSDPLADGQVIQKSSQHALENGMSLRLLFEQLKNIREHVNIPIVLMGYLNPVLQYGFKEFLSKCKEIQVDGLIIPDLPLRIYEEEYRDLMEDSGLEFIMLITPQTSNERIRQIVAGSSSSHGGFLYMVADSSTTGARTNIKDAQIDYFKRINSMEIKIPRLIGFGISNAETFRGACEYANGAIIGSAFIEAIGPESKESLPVRINAFVKSILGETVD